MTHPVPMHVVSFVVLAAGAGLSACGTTRESAAEESSASADGEAAAGKAKKEAKRLRDLEVARLELEKAQLEADAERREAESHLQKARRELAAAEQALNAYVQKEIGIKLDDERISVDRAVYAADHAKDELNELKAMYAAEEFAELTKELVIKRGERELEIAERNLDVARRELELLEGEEMPRKRRELEDKVTEARIALEAAEAKVQAVRLASEIALMKARHEIQELEAGGGADS